jgi:nucleoside-diphosphate-sugar epimerase
VGRGVPAAALGCVDVRDVADAHVAALGTPHAAGQRYLLLADSRPCSLLDLVQTLRATGKFAAYPLPEQEAGQVKYWPKYSNYKAEHHLNLNFTPISNSIVDMADALIRLGIVPPPDVVHARLEAARAAAAAAPKAKL